jgi:hypothetical protein
MYASILTIGVLLGAQTPPQRPAADEAALKEFLFPFYAREAASYEIFRDADHKEKLKLRKEPLLTWTNADGYMGSVFVWEFGGRPEMIGCIGSHQNKPASSAVFHELHSLATVPLGPVPFGGGKEIWRVSEAGVKFATIDGAPPPANSEGGRLTQMRGLAREFRGWMKVGDDVTELRLLAQPIIRYSAREQGVVDGAIFAMVQNGTDPEVLIVLEDRKVDGKEQWQFALARFNYCALWVERKDKEIWRVDVSHRNEIYNTATIGDRTYEQMRQAAAETKKE